MSSGSLLTVAGYFFDALAKIIESVMVMAPHYVDGFNVKNDLFRITLLLKETIFVWWMVVATQRFFSFTDSLTLDMFFFQDGKKRKARIHRGT